jgi:hypothetical protein
MKLLSTSLALLATTLAAQAPSPRSATLFQAAETITAQDIMRRVSIIAADSMMGRDTPSRGLEVTAEYVAREFRRAGLLPLGDGGSYFQRFGVTRWVVDTGRSVVEFTAGGAYATLRLGRDARLIEGPIPEDVISGPMVLMTSTRPTAGVRDRVVLLVKDMSRPIPASWGRELLDLVSAGPKAVLVLSNRDPAVFADRLRMSALPRFTLDSSAGSLMAPVIEVPERALRSVLAAAGLDPERLRRAPDDHTTNPKSLGVELRLARTVLAHARVPNVVGMLEGSDPVLRNEYLVYSAHIDHIGISRGQADSINNGADDNASGVAGLLELAEAFGRLGHAPERSIIFLAPSAEEPGLLGSSFFTEHPPVALEQIVANVNMDLIGRNWRDSVIAVGIDQSDLGETLAGVTRAHPELRMMPIADRWPEERIFYRSDHYSFARRGVPSLFFTSGTHPDYHRPTDDAGLIDGEKESRLVKLLWHLGTTIAGPTPRPQWHPESYREIVGRS